MRLRYLYGGTVIGELERTEDGRYIYNSDPGNQEKLLTKNSTLGDLPRGLWSSENVESDELPPAFEKLIKDFSREDILTQANIKPGDSKWEQLVKLSTLKVHSSAFHVQQTSSESGTESGSETKGS